MPAARCVARERGAAETGARRRRQHLSDRRSYQVGYRRGRRHRRRMTRQLCVRDPDRRGHRHRNGRLRMLHAVAPATARFAAVPDGVSGFVGGFSRRLHRRGVGCACLRVVMAWHAPRFRHGRRRLRRSAPLEGHWLHVGPGNSRRYPVQHEGQAQQQSQEDGADGHVRTLTGVPRRGYRCGSGSSNRNARRARRLMHEYVAMRANRPFAPYTDRRCCPAS